MLEVQVVSLNCKYLARIFRNPFVVALIEVGKVFYADAFLVFASALLYL